MKSHFYNRTPYPHINVPVPVCFIEMDNYFDSKFSDINELFKTAGLKLTENICRRIADVDMYASVIENMLNNSNAYKAATLTGSFMVGYLSACKSLLDAGSISLSEIYSLPLSNKEKDFSKGKFWNQLLIVNKVVHKRYFAFKKLFEEIIKWRDAAVHRIAPLIIVHGKGHPEKVKREDMEIKMIADPNLDISDFIANTKETEWIEPLDLHKNWRGEFIKFCEELCKDIKTLY